MKTVRKCFLALLSTAALAVGASGAQAQSLPGGQDLNPQSATSVDEAGTPGTAGPSASRASSFPVNGDQAISPTPAGTPAPLVPAPLSDTGIQVVGAQPGNALDVAQLPEVGPLPQGMAGQPVGAGQNQTPLAMASSGASGPPLPYMTATGASPYPAYGVVPAGYPAPQAGYGQPTPAAMPGPLPTAYGQPPAFPASPGMYPAPPMGLPPGPPHSNGYAMQAGYSHPQMLPPGIGGIAGPAGQPGGQTFCGCGGVGCSNCGLGGGYGAGHGGGFLAGLLSRFLPYAEGGQCAPRWYDVTMDAMYLAREETSRRIDFTADGPGPDPNIIMSTDDLEFDEKIGVRMNAAIQVLATATAEFTYFGLFSWSDTDNRMDLNGGLFSPMSQFATFPPGGFPQTDNAIFHSISYSSSLDNFEMNFRRRWTAPNCRVQASFLMGVRYLYLLEDFQYFTQGRDDIDPDPTVVEPGGTMDYNIRARNSLTGFQLGADLWSTIIPGVKFGGELKAGAYGNYANQTTVIDVTEPNNTYNESVGMNDIAVITDANLMAIWRVNPNWTLRAGYSLIYIDGVALAPEQFNSTPPNVIFPGPIARTPGSNDNGSAFYHGGFAGLEWQW